MDWVETNVHISCADWRRRTSTFASPKKHTRQCKTSRCLAVDLVAGSGFGKAGLSIVNHCAPHSDCKVADETDHEAPVQATAQEAPSQLQEAQSCWHP